MQRFIVIDQIDWIIPHQANARIIESAAKHLQIGEDKFYVNLNEYGNTSAASVPIALCEAIEKGHIQPGQQIVLVGFGAGLTWGATVLKWEPFIREKPAPIYRKWLRWLVYRWAAFHTYWLRIMRTHTARARNLINRWYQRYSRRKP